jgi:hypothetical protein
MCVDIRGVLRWSNKKLAGMFTHDDGRRCSGPDAREFLLDQLALGRRVLPMGGPCEGFSYETGCPGHPVPDEPEESDKSDTPHTLTR